MLGMDFGDILGLALFLALVVGGIAWMIAEMRKNRASTFDDCEECGYDMRATPQRCPECGWRPPKRERAPGSLDVKWLVDTSPIDAINPRVPEPTEERIVLYETDHWTDAETLCEHLTVRGIACDVSTEESTMQRGAYLGRPLYHRVVVWSGDREEAETLVRGATRSNVTSVT